MADLQNVQIIQLILFPNFQANACSESDHDKILHNADRASRLEKLVHVECIITNWIENRLNDQQDGDKDAATEAEACLCQLSGVNASLILKNQLRFPLVT